MTTLKCAGCGATFTRSPTHVRHARSFCSPACYNIDQRKKLTRYVKPDGYVTVARNGKRVLEHRAVLEEHLGRKLLRSEHVHHINGQRGDNRVENLRIVDCPSHLAEHADERFRTDDVRALHASGLSIKEIAERVGSNYQTVWYRLRRQGTDWR